MVIKMRKKEKKIDPDIVFSKFVSKKNNIEKMVNDTNQYTMLEQIDNLSRIKHGIVNEVVFKIKDKSNSQEYIINLNKDGLKQVYSCKAKNEICSAELILNEPQILSLYNNFITNIVEFSNHSYYSYMLHAKNEKIADIREKIETSNKTIGWLSVQLKSSQIQILSRMDVEELLSRERTKYQNLENELGKELIYLGTLIRSNPSNQRQ